MNFGDDPAGHHANIGDRKGIRKGDSPPGCSRGDPLGAGALAGTLVWTGEGRGGTTPLGHRGIRLMKTFLLRLFTWWNGQTFGTQVWTRLYGELVGEDEFGNLLPRPWR